MRNIYLGDIVSYHLSPTKIPMNFNLNNIERVVKKLKVINRLKDIESDLTFVQDFSDSMSSSPHTSSFPIECPSW